MSFFKLALALTAAAALSLAGVSGTTRAASASVVDTSNTPQTDSPIATLSAEKWNAVLYLRGRTKVGETLSAGLETYPAGTKFTYKWTADGEVIKGATKSTFKLTGGLEGKRIRVKITAKKVGYKTLVKRSGSTDTVDPKKSPKLTPEQKALIEAGRLAILAEFNLKASDLSGCSINLKESRVICGANGKVYYYKY